MIHCADKNARLLVDLINDLGAIGLGQIHAFFETDPTWHCPCCHRSKREFARLDQNRNLLCSIHRHHDHFVDKAHEIIKPKFTKENADRLSSARDSFVRFDYVLICNDCNLADPVAKRLVGAPAYFSFAPHEISHFIRVNGNSGHLVDSQRAHEAYEAAKPMMRLLAARLREFSEAIDIPKIGEFEHVGSFLSRAITKTAKGEV